MDWNKLKKAFLIKTLGLLMLISGLGVFLISSYTTLHQIRLGTYGKAHNLTGGILLGLYLIITGLGLIKLRKWAIIMSAILGGILYFRS